MEFSPLSILKEMKTSKMAAMVVYYAHCHIFSTRYRTHTIKTSFYMFSDIRNIIVPSCHLLYVKNAMKTVVKLRQTVYFELSAGLTQFRGNTVMYSFSTKLWVDCLIKPVFVILKYIRAERKADWVLHLVHLDTVKDTVPLFFAAGMSTMPGTHSTIYELRKASPVAYVRNSSMDSTRCTTTLVCSMAFEVTWPLKLPS